jgi:hypothetical protein
MEFYHRLQGKPEKSGHRLIRMGSGPVPFLTVLTLCLCGLFYFFVGAALAANALGKGLSKFRG